MLRGGRRNTSGKIAEILTITRPGNTGFSHWCPMTEPTIVDILAELIEVCELSQNQIAFIGGLPQQMVNRIAQKDATPEKLTLRAAVGILKGANVPEEEAKQILWESF